MQPLSFIDVSEVGNSDKSAATDLIQKIDGIYHAFGTVAAALRRIAGNARCSYSDLAQADFTGLGPLYLTFTILRKGLAKV